MQEVTTTRVEFPATEAKDVLTEILREGAQTLTFTPVAAKEATMLMLNGTVMASEEAFPAETLSAAQGRFPYIRNSVGLSRNLRNNAIYDRRWDWVLIGPTDGATRVTPKIDGENQRTFGIQCRGASLQLVFRPRFYQKHKNLQFYEPWTYKVWEGSITGFCTWWAYKGGITQDTIDNIVAVFKGKNLVDFGYEYLQIDAGWATGTSPERYLNWNNKFPGGPQYVVRKEAGMKPGIHTAVVFRPGDKIVGEIVKKHPEWFLQIPDGSVLNAGMYTLNPFNEDALDGLIRPTYKGLSEQGWEYVKIDGEGNLMAWGYSEYPRDNLERLPEPRIHLRHPQLNHAPQYGKQPTWWMLEIDKPFEHWSVLARFNWREISRHWARGERPAEEVSFSNLGLSEQKEYLVYEFWSKRVQT